MIYFKRTNIYYKQFNNGPNQQIMKKLENMLILKMKLLTVKTINPKKTLRKNATNLKTQEIQGRHGNSIENLQFLFIIF